MDVAGSLLGQGLSKTSTNATKLLIASLVVNKASLIKGITVIGKLKHNMELKTGCFGLVHQQCLEVRTTHHFYTG